MNVTVLNCKEKKTTSYFIEFYEMVKNRSVMQVVSALIK